jgi:hypothetical protein
VQIDAGNRQVDLHWGEPLSTGDLDLARTWILRGPTEDQLKPLTVVAAGVQSFTDADLTNGSDYYYALRSEDTAGGLSPDSKAQKAVPFKALTPPRNVSALGVGDTVVRLKWDPPADGATFKVKGYNVYRSTAPAMDLSAPPINKVLLTPDTTRWEDDGEESIWPPKLGTVYDYEVVAVDEQDNPSSPSAMTASGPSPSVTNLNPGEIQVFNDNSLQIQGRKTISVSNTWLVQSNSNQQIGTGGAGGGFNLDQQLQVRLTGKVGRKIKVDVDYDDKATADQQQKISVVYNGDNQEVFKEFAFGDISMDLGVGRTEFFMPTAKSLFGAKLTLESPDGRLRLTAVGAQTKGFTETKTFVGGYESVMTGNNLGRNIQDTSFTAYKFYYLSRDLESGQNLHVVPNSVIIDYDLGGTTNLIPSAVPAFTAQGDKLNLVRLTQGTDYLVDSATGLITFLDSSAYRPQAACNLVVAFRVQGNSGGPIQSYGYNAAGTDIALTSAGLESDKDGGISTAANGYHMIQYGTRYGASQYDAHMSCQFYNLGDRDILAPEKDPDFKLNVYGPNQTLIYPLNVSGYTNYVNFDLQGGWMRWQVPYPFAKTTTNSGDLFMDIPGYTKALTPLNSAQADAYDVVNRISNFTIHIEYKHKLASYNLRFNIIHGSEVIILDGRRMVRDMDYFLDYTTGILVFSNPDAVKDTSTVTATYEYAPLGGQYTSTVWGGRLEYDLTKGISLGGAFLWNSADQPQTTPDVNSAPYSLQILDGDVQATIPQAMLDKLTRAVPFLPQHSEVLKIKASGEAAHSWFNPNTYSRNNENGVAMVDDFESVDAIVGVSTARLSWFPSSRPLRFLGDPGPAYSDRRFNNLGEDTNEADKAHDYVARLAAGQDPHKDMLEMDYHNMDTPNRWDSWVTSFGPQPNQAVTASDQLEIWYYSTGSAVLHVDVGEINEDAVANGVLATESTAGILCDTCDTGILTNQTLGSPYPLPPIFGGPAGYYSAAPGYSPNGYWGWNNRILDTEDFNGNGSLDLANNYYSFTIPLVNTQSGFANTANLAQVLLDLTKPDAVITGPGISLSTVFGTSNYYTNISRVRFWVDGCQNPDGTIRLETFQFDGEKWQVRADPNLVNFAGVSVTADSTKFQVSGINENETNNENVPAYRKYQPDLNFFDTTSGTTTNLSEQSLQIRYQVTALDGSGGEPYYQARRILGSGTNLDLGSYTKLRLDMYKPFASNPGERFLIRLATDDQDYFEYVVPLDNISVTNWNSVTLTLDGTDGNRTQVGFPNLRQVNYCAVAIASLSNSLNPFITPGFENESDPSYPGSELLWLDNLRVTDPITRDGGASKAAFNYDVLNGALTVNQQIRDVDSDFVMMDQESNQPARHLVQQTVDAKLNAIKNLPITVHYDDTEQFVDPAHADDPLYSNLYSLPDQSSQKTAGTVSLSAIPYAPGLSLDAAGYSQHIRQIFLPDAIRQLQTAQGEDITPNAEVQNQHATTDLTYKVPDPVWGLKGDQLNLEMDYDDNVTLLDHPSINPSNVAYRDQSKQTYTFKGRYGGTYHWGHWLTLSPSYAYTLIQAKGTLAAPTDFQGTPYYVLDINGNSQGDGAWGIPQTRAINPSLVLQFGDLALLKSPKIAYNFTQTRDYVRNELRTPGSLDMSTSLAPANLGPFFKGWPSVDMTQSWQVDSDVTDDLRIRGLTRTAQLLAWAQANPGFADRYDFVNNMEYVPNIALAEQQPALDSVWWVRMDGTNGLGENVSDPLNIENIAISSSRRSITNASTRFDSEPFKGWPMSWTPHLNITDARVMSAPEQVTENNQWGAGLGLDMKEPHIPFWQTLHPSTLSLAYDYSDANNYVDQIDIQQLTSNRVSNTLRATLPTRPSDLTTLTLSVNWTLATDADFTPGTNGVSQLTGSDMNQMWEPDIKLVYFLNVDHSFKMWDVWPFYGKELKVKQQFRLDNDLDLQFKTGSQTLSTANLPNSGSNSYSLRDQVTYNVLDNLKVNFALQQKLYNNSYANQAINQTGNYYSIQISLGAEATF